MKNLKKNFIQNSKFKIQNLMLLTALSFCFISFAQKPVLTVPAEGGYLQIGKSYNFQIDQYDGYDRMYVVEYQSKSGSWIEFWNSNKQDVTNFNKIIDCTDFFNAFLSGNLTSRDPVAVKFRTTRRNRRERNPKTGKEVTYYIYGGNSPISPIVKVACENKPTTNVCFPEKRSFGSYSINEDRNFYWFDDLTNALAYSATYTGTPKYTGRCWNDVPSKPNGVTNYYVLVKDNICTGNQIQQPTIVLITILPKPELLDGVIPKTVYLADDTGLPENSICSVPNVTFFPLITGIGNLLEPTNLEPIPGTAIAISYTTVWEHNTPVNGSHKVYMTNNSDLNTKPIYSKKVCASDILRDNNLSKQRLYNLIIKITYNMVTKNSAGIDQTTEILCERRIPVIVKVFDPNTDVTCRTVQKEPNMQLNANDILLPNQTFSWSPHENLVNPNELSPFVDHTALQDGVYYKWLLTKTLNTGLPPALIHPSINEYKCFATISYPPIDGFETREESNVFQPIESIPFPDVLIYPNPVGNSENFNIQVDNLGDDINSNDVFLIVLISDKPLFRQQIFSNGTYQFPSSVLEKGITKIILMIGDKVITSKTLLK
jgi:hypothetical protein